MTKRVNRRRFFKRLALYGLPVLTVGEMAWLEPRWLKVNRLRLATGTPVARLVHFTGDIIEDTEHLAEALELLGRIKAPLYGVPGNHDYWSRADFAEIGKAFAATGGAWLMDASAAVAGGRVQLHGLTCETAKVIAPQPGATNILLAHYPAWCEKVAPHRYDLMLAGHSHGGQVRIPFYGPVVTPYGVGRYDLGRFDTPAGPLYVGAGIGYFYVNFRFRCRPEITLIEI